MNSNYTGRFHRSLDSAFGPYERSSTAWIEPMSTEQPLHPADRIVLIGCALACAALLVIFACEWIWS